MTTINIRRLLLSNIDTHLSHHIPDDHKPGVARQVEESRDVPAEQGGDEVADDILSAVTLVLAAGPAVIPVQVDDALTVLYQLVDQFEQ